MSKSKKNLSSKLFTIIFLISQFCCGLSRNASQPLTNVSKFDKRFYRKTDYIWRRRVTHETSKILQFSNSTNVFQRGRTAIFQEINDIRITAVFFESIFNDTKVVCELHLFPSTFTFPTMLMCYEANKKVNTLTPFVDHYYRHDAYKMAEQERYKELFSTGGMKFFHDILCLDLIKNNGLNVKSCFKLYQNDTNSNNLLFDQSLYSDVELGTIVIYDEKSKIIRKFSTSTIELIKPGYHVFYKMIKTKWHLVSHAGYILTPDSSSSTDIYLHWGNETIVAFRESENYLLTDIFKGYPVAFYEDGNAVRVAVVSLDEDPLSWKESLFLGKLRSQNGFGEDKAIACRDAEAEINNLKKQLEFCQPIIEKLEPCFNSLGTEAESEIGLFDLFLAEMKIGIYYAGKLKVQNAQNALKDCKSSGLLKEEVEYQTQILNYHANTNMRKMNNYLLLKIDSNYICQKASSKGERKIVRWF